MLASPVRSGIPPITSNRGRPKLSAKKSHVRLLEAVKSEYHHGPAPAGETLRGRGFAL